MTWYPSKNPCNIDYHPIDWYNVINSFERRFGRMDDHTLEQFINNYEYEFTDHHPEDPEPEPEDDNCECDEPGAIHESF